MSDDDKLKWPRVKALFKEVRTLPPNEREGWLRSQCGDHAELLEAVLRLLNSEAPDSDIGSIIRDAARETVADTAEAVINQRVGNYRLIELVGTGGMGNVYLAERVDDSFDHRVAIKLLHANPRDPSLIQRFQLERQTLANLDHPNIARLLDGGETESGVPYLVMEYVDGVSIDSYCDEQRMSVRERLEVFKKVCSAVDYAHRSLIVHRDIKPSNILVNSSGEPKLLDFGIAKILDSAAAHAIAPTRQGKEVMTPEFASPEQVRGEPITTATDIYSLGVLLYILLSGRRPYLEHATNMAAIAKAICDTEPSRPSTAITLGSDQDNEVPRIVASRKTSLGKLTKLLTGDLDNIVMMTLQKEPDRRYPSARALSDDIDNYLSDQAVSARADSMLYRGGKFVRRNRWGVAAAALILTLVIGFPSFYSVKVTEQRDFAEREAEKAARVSEFMLSLFSTPDPDQAKGETITARVLLDQGALRIEQELEDQPEVRAAMQDVMGGAYLGLGLYERSGVLLDSALRTRLTLFGEMHSDVLQTSSRIAHLATSSGDFQRSEKLYREAIELSQYLHGADGVDTAMLLSGLANAIYEQGRHDEARALYEQALDMHERLSPNPSREKATTMHGYGWLLTNMAEFEAAESILRDSVAMLRQTVGELHPEVPAAMNHLTFTLMDSGQWDKAEANMRAGLRLTTRIYGDTHPSVSGDLFTLGTILQEKGEYAEAESLYRRGLAIDIELLGENHPYIASDKNNLGGVLKSLGRYDEGLALYRESLELNQRLFGQEHPETATNLSNVGLTLLQLGRFDEAREMLDEATRIRTEVLGVDHPATLSSRNINAIYLRVTEKFHAARAAFEKSLADRTRVLGTTHTGRINTLLGLSELLTEMSLPEEASIRIAEVQSIVEAELEEMHPIRIRTTIARAALADAVSDSALALQLYPEAVAQYRQILSAQDPRLARVLIKYGDLLTREDDAAAALPMLQEAVTIREAVLPDGHWEIAAARSVLGSCQSALGLPEAEATLLQSSDRLLATRGPASRHTRRALERLDAHRARN